MATLTTSAEISFDPGLLDLSQILSGSWYTTKPTMYRATQGNGYYDEFRGNGFSYNGDGTPTGGAVTSYAHSDYNGKRLYVIEGMNVPIASFLKAAGTFSSADDQRVFADVFRGNDVLRGGEKWDVLAGYAGNDTLVGNGGPDKLYGGGGNDLLRGGTGKDELYGDEGDDLLFGGADTDKLNGGAGTDTAHYGEASAAVHASLLALALNKGDAKGDTYVSVENLTGSRFADTLVGNTGRNALDGGLGQDILNGGAGADSFVFSTKLGASNVDTIQSFSAKDDTFWLDRDIFTAAGKIGGLASGAFHTSATGLAHDTTDRILYNAKTGDLFYDADGSGKTAAVQFAHVDPALTLTHADFLIVV